MTSREYFHKSALKTYPTPKLWDNGSDKHIRENRRNAYRLGADDAVIFMTEFMNWASWNKWVRWDDKTWRKHFDDSPVTFEELFNTFLIETKK